MAKMKTLTLNNIKYDVDDATAVKHTEQSLANEEKAQARKNIGAMSNEYEINPDLNLLVLGDSLFGKEYGKTFIKELGCNIQNYAVSGASLAEVSGRLREDQTYNSVLDQYERFKNGQDPYLESGENINTRLNGNSDFTEPDIILVDGGGNDYIVGAAMGSPNDNPFTYEDDKTYDTSTVMGALESLLRDIAMTYPKAQRFFLIMHRVYYCSISSSTGAVNRVYWSTYQNAGGYTYDTLRENIIKICNIYGFKIIDLYNDSLLNTAPPSTIELESVTNTTTGVSWWAFTHPITGKITSVGLESSVSLSANPIKVANVELLDWKGIHPTLLGYQIGYAPYIKQSLCLGTKK